MENNQDKKIFFIPGWMKSLKYYNQESGLDVWLDSKEFDRKLESGILVGHSLGTNVALNKYSAGIEKIILVNPVITKKNFVGVLWAWIKFKFDEENSSDKNVPLIKMLTTLPVVSRLAKKNYEEIISKIPKENIIVLRGKNDNYLCDQSCADFFKKFQINVLEIEEAGHNWSDVFDQEVKRIINS